MSTVQEIEQAGPLRRGLLVWYAAFGSVGAWTVHLVGEASLVGWTEHDTRWRWILHALTAACIIANAIALWLAWRLRTIAKHADESSADDAGQLLFLSHLGLLFGIIDLALIVIEGAYAVVLSQGHAALR
jgi:hypothetical protein